MICVKCKQERGQDFIPSALDNKWPSKRICRPCNRTYWNAWKVQNYERVTLVRRNYARTNWPKIRLAVLMAYSKGVPTCACCGEHELKFLGIDHINGGGKRHRQEIHSGSVYGWLKARKYPPGYQVLCHNCNLAKGFYGMCPHLEGK